MDTSIDFRHYRKLILRHLPNLVKAKGELTVNNMEEIMDKYADTLLICSRFESELPHQTLTAQAYIRQRIYKWVKFNEDRIITFTKEEVVLPRYCPETQKEILYWMEDGKHDQSVKVFKKDNNKDWTPDNLLIISREGGIIRGLKKPRIKKVEPVVQTPATIVKESLQAQPVATENTQPTVAPQKRTPCKSRAKTSVSLGQPMGVVASVPVDTVKEEIDIITAVKIFDDELSALSVAFQGKKKLNQPEAVYQIWNFVNKYKN